MGEKAGLSFLHPTILRSPGYLVTSVGLWSLRNAADFSVRGQVAGQNEGQGAGALALSLSLAGHRAI